MRHVAPEGFRAVALAGLFPSRSGPSHGKKTGEEQGGKRRILRTGAAFAAVSEIEPEEAAKR
jgi:hypothetical protein